MQRDCFLKWKHRGENRADFQQTETNDSLIHEIVRKNHHLHLAVRASERRIPIETIAPVGYSRSVAVSISD